MMTLSLFTRPWPGLSHILSCKGVGECGFTLCSHVPSEESGALSPRKKGEHELWGQLVVCHLAFLEVGSCLGK